MRKLTLLCLTLFVFLSLAGCDALKWKRYHNREYNFSLLLMKDWEIDEDSRDALLVVYMPQYNLRSGFRSNMRVLIQELPSEMPLSTYYDMNREELLQVFPRHANIKEGQGMTGLVRYQWISFDANIAKGILVRALNAVWIKGKRVYILSCVMEFDAVKELEPLVNKVISSFNL